MKLVPLTANVICTVQEMQKALVSVTQFYSRRSFARIVLHAVN